MAKSQSHKHEIVGVVEFIPYEEYASHGYLDAIPDYPVLEYKRITSEDQPEANRYWRPEGLEQELPGQPLTYKIVYDYMVTKRYDLEEAKAMFPELFLWHKNNII